MVLLAAELRNMVMLLEHWLMIEELGGAAHLPDVSSGLMMTHGVGMSGEEEDTAAWLREMLSQTHQRHGTHLTNPTWTASTRSPNSKRSTKVVRRRSSLKTMMKHWPARGSDENEHSEASLSHHPETSVRRSSQKSPYDSPQHSKHSEPPSPVEPFFQEMSTRGIFETWHQGDLLQVKRRELTPQSVIDCIWVELSTVQDEAMTLAARALRDWKLDTTLIDKVSHGHSLLVVGSLIFKEYGLFTRGKINLSVFQAFLCEIELNYGSRPYHNRVHAADVLLSVHHFIQFIHAQNFLSATQLIALFLAAIIHDFNHPGTTNAHEVKTQSPRAIMYSDQSVLERHHLACGFMVLSDPRFQVLSGLTASEYFEVRGSIIDIVLHTDLAMHFDFVSKMKSIAALHGHTPHTRSVKGKGLTFRRRHKSVEPLSSPSAGHSLSTRFGRRNSLPEVDERPAVRLCRSSEELQPQGLVIDGDALCLAPKEKAHNPEGEVHSKKTSFIFSTSVRGDDEEPETGDSNSFTQPEWKTPLVDTSKVTVQELLIAAIKYADLGHVIKPLEVHIEWTDRITREFWELGDREKNAGVPLSPLCDREKDTSIAKSQVGFIKFVCLPFYEVLGELVAPDFQPLGSVLSNQQHWQREIEKDMEQKKPPEEPSSNQKISGEQA